jgi:two-component system chemotaxis response regulator CheB
LPLVVIGASLGGLEALALVLGSLPAGLPAGIAVVQHRRPDGDSRLADLLASRCALRVREAQDKDPIEAGAVYIAPADYHLLIDERSVALSVDAPVSRARPSIDVLMESAAEAAGTCLVAVLLTSASDDGAHGIELVARRGGVTIVQNPDEAMSPIGPRAAIARTKVDHILALVEVGPRIQACVETLARAQRRAATIRI